MDLYFEINLGAVFTAGILAHLLGMLWYSKYLFGNTLNKINHTSHPNIASISGDPIALPKKLNKIFLGLFWIIVAYIVAYFVQLYGATTTTSSAKLGFMIWLLVASSGATSVYFENKNFNAFLIRVGYYLIAIVGMAILLSFWHFK